MRKKILLMTVCCLLLVTGCMADPDKDVPVSDNATGDLKEDNTEVFDIKVTIDDKEYLLHLEDNEAADELVALLPQEFVMRELNGNEKYVYMDCALTDDPYVPERIEKGDVMLFGNDCLVIFYKSFATTYSYTRIGHIDDLGDLGGGSITAVFAK